MRLAVSISVFYAMLMTPANLAGQSEDTLSLRFKSISFIRNNEYYSPLAEGYTLPGYFIQPELVYKPSGRITLRLGAHLLSYSGTGKFSDIRPRFSSVLKITENSSLTLGSLSGSDRHRLSDPLFFSEKTYTDYSEDGIQFMVENSHLFSDTWVSWENFIFKGGTDREIFTAGESLRYSSSLFSGLLNINLPLQIHIKHFGGQITDYPEPVETFLTSSAGAGVGYNLDGGRLFADYLFFYNNQLNGADNTELIKGHAHWMKVGYTIRGLKLELGSWNSHSYYAPDGNPIFCSVSVNNQKTSDDNKIITTGLYLNLSPENLIDIFFAFEGFYFTGSRRFDNSLSLHLSFDRLFRIAVLK